MASPREQTTGLATREPTAAPPPELWRGRRLSQGLAAVSLMVCALCRWCCEPWDAGNPVILIQTAVQGHTTTTLTYERQIQSPSSRLSSNALESPVAQGQQVGVMTQWHFV